MENDILPPSGFCCCCCCCHCIDYTRFESIPRHSWTNWADRKSILSSHVTRHKDFACNILFKRRRRTEQNIKKKCSRNYFNLICSFVELWIIDSIFGLRSISNRTWCSCELFRVAYNARSLRYVYHSAHSRAGCFFFVHFLGCAHIHTQAMKCWWFETSE